MSNKNQHFVSQGYLRQFGIPDEGKQPRAVNLFATKAKKVIFGASIKNQCSRDYFYGREQVFDDLLQAFEQRYGVAVANLKRGQPSPQDIEVLSQFMFLQFLRTPFQVQQRLRVAEEWRSMEVAGVRVRDKLPPPDAVREAQHQLYIFAKGSSSFSDLRPVILVNRTSTPFITSDNPANCMNRLYAQRYRDSTAGIIQSGTIACLPISPRIQLMAYDEDVYQPIGNRFVMEVQKVNDVNRLNQLQVIRASDALFFQSARDEAYVTSLFEAHQGCRREDWSITWSGIREGETDEFEVFRKVRPEDSESLEPRIQSLSPILPAPSSWPSFLRFRMRPKGWTTGSAVGFIRAAHAQMKKGIREVHLPDHLPRQNAPEFRERLYQYKK